MSEIVSFVVTPTNFSKACNSNDDNIEDLNVENNNNNSCSSNSTNSSRLNSPIWLLVRLFLLGSIYTGLGVTNNLAFWAVGNAMPKYQTFLAYASCFFNPLVFVCVWHFLRKKIRKKLAVDTEEISKPIISSFEEEAQMAESKRERAILDQSLFPSGKTHLLAMLYGMCIATNSVCGMWSDSHVGGLLQNILNQFMLPIMAFLSRVCLKQKMNGFEVWGSVIVMIGSVFGIITSFDDADSPQEGGGQMVFWVLVYVLCIASLPPQSVLQQTVVTKFQINPVPLIFAGSCYAILFSLLGVFLDTLPPFVGPGLSLPQVIVTQQAAWRCVLGAINADCGEGAWQLYLLYAVTGALMAWIQMVLVEEESPMFFVIIDAVSVPVTAISFCVPAFMGPAVETLTWQTLVSVGIIMVGIVVFKMKEIVEAVSQRSSH